MIQKRLLPEEKLSAMLTDEALAAGNDYGCAIQWVRIDRMRPAFGGPPSPVRGRL